MTHEQLAATTCDLVPAGVFADLRIMVAAAMPHLSWRYNGLGVLQAYLWEGSTDELRVHIWHPSLEKPGIRTSGKIHDHRFDLRSTVLLGAIGHVEYDLTPDPSGFWEAHEVVNARKAMADESVYKAGLFDGQVESTCEYFCARTLPWTFRERDVYSYPKGCFHESHVDALAVTLVRKRHQEDRKARILAPRWHEVTHAFAQPKPVASWIGLIEEARLRLLEVVNDEVEPVRRVAGEPAVVVRPVEGRR